MRSDVRRFLQLLEKRSSFIATGLLAFMFVFALLSSAGNPFPSSSNPGDSTTTDEQPHIVSGYSYLIKREYRLNPEHPPLVKDLAAIPLLFLHLRFPDTHTAWTEDINGQWTAGAVFLHDLGNDVDAILFWSRLPMMIVMVLLGALLFLWTKKMWGSLAGLAALVLYVFSPTVIAHGRLVTTDLPIAFFTTLAFYGCWRFLDRPSWGSLVLCGVLLGFAQLTKFSAVTLFVIFPLIMGAVMIARGPSCDFPLFRLRCLRSLFLRRAVGYGTSAVFMMIIAFFIIGAVYIFHVWEMPSEKIVTLIDGSLYRDDLETVKGILKKMAFGNVVLKAYAQYALGVFMVFQRSVGGNTTYFLGEVGSSGWWYYFPIIFFLKEPLPLHALWLWALGGAIVRSFRGVIRTSDDRFRYIAQSLRRFIEHRYAEFAMLLFITVYVFMSVQSNLNIGVRHLLPIFPFLFMLLGKFVSRLMTSGGTRLSMARLSILVVLGVWLVIGWSVAYPSYLSYFNESIGGSANGYRYAADSNADWGQDLKRLRVWMEEHDVEVIHLDYFGGGSTEYELGYRAQQMHPEMTEVTGWVAVSATLYLSSFAEEPTYGFLDDRGIFVGSIGNSILLYRIEE